MQPNVAETIARMDGWLQSMRGPGGYSGPISHWWESSLLYCGPMADWRYEGIICGYLSLYRSSGAAVWLERARQAGDDLVAAQLPSGKFRNSAFQQGPIEGGTPHEAAVDVALLELARTLCGQGDAGWQTYFEVARRNITAYLLGELWNGCGFRDQPWNTTLVPNKNATTLEALALYETLAGQDMTEYLEKAAGVILANQERVGPRAGATVHVGTGRHRLAIGIYTARSICGLLRMHERRADDALLDAVHAALGFLRGLITPRGVYFGRYPDGSLIANPRIIAGAGDLLRAFIWGRAYGLAADADVAALARLLVREQFASGGLPTALGLARRGDRQEYAGRPEFRDVLPVAGWIDKAWRALALLGPAPERAGGPAACMEAQIECTWGGRDCRFEDSATELRLCDARTNDLIYCWRKGTCYPNIVRL
jgi:hypothetical protein